MVFHNIIFTRITYVWLLITGIHSADDLLMELHCTDPCLNFKPFYVQILEGLHIIVGIYTVLSKISSLQQPLCDSCAMYYHKV